MRSLRVDAVLVQAVIAGALSFAHLHDIAEAAGQDGWKAWAYPISVDLLLVAAWRRLRALQADGSPAAAAWTWFLIALAASLGANVATAGLLDLGDVPDWLRILVAGWPALAFLGGTLLVHSPNNTAEHTADETEDQALYVDRVESTEPVPATDPAPAALEPTEAPAPPATRPEPEPEPAPVQPVEKPRQAPAAASVPSALVDHARKLADAHRARTGSPMDTDTLRARLGVPAPMADAIAAQLT
ncbi:DUF2637 domain-containing protein [Streptomyces sp. RKND-216]|uniref:DUF2637 domain-containing protein n=1 Tax=Streptomyces sp. RKND-216 TaxID=2562581 RepID=UPI00109DCC1E|nr:DUF2637 domain-containing protein [Streptomyces sp. RKND-216]THA25086.1 DUF2637 domain-containing protein [Streptomyces sp. RKND-216]